MPLPSTGTHRVLELGLEDLRITELRGPMTRQVRHEVLRQGGEKAWQALLATVSPACRECFSRPIGLYEWIPAQMSNELSLAYLAHGDADFIRRRSVDAAREQTWGQYAASMLIPPVCARTIAMNRISVAFLSTSLCRDDEQQTSRSTRCKAKS